MVFFLFQSIHIWLGPNMTDLPVRTKSDALAAFQTFHVTAFRLI